MPFRCAVQEEGCSGLIYAARRAPSRLFCQNRRPGSPARLLAEPRAVHACGIGRVRSLPTCQVFWLWRARTTGSLSWAGSLLPRLRRSDPSWHRTARAYLGGFPPPSPPYIALARWARLGGCPWFGDVAMPCRSRQGRTKPATGSPSRSGDGGDAGGRRRRTGTPIIPGGWEGGRCPFSSSSAPTKLERNTAMPTSRGP